MTDDIDQLYSPLLDLSSTSDDCVATENPRPVDAFFSTAHVRDDLNGRSVRGGLTCLVGQLIVFVMKVGAIAILARILTPGDFGLVAMVTAVMGFADIFKDAGLSLATVQQSEVTDAQVSTLFWANVGLSVAMMTLMIAIAPGIAWFYRETRLVGITWGLAGTFLFGGLAAQHQSLLIRQMRFGTLTLIQVLSQAVGLAAAISAAVVGGRYWALVIMSAATAAASATLVWLSCRWIPGRPRRGAGVRRMFAFGGNMTAFNLVNYWACNGDNLLIGRFWGAHELGVYSRAYQLLLWPVAQLTSPISAVVVPALSRLNRQPAKWASFFLQSLRVCIFLTVPLCVFLALEADAAVLLVLGKRWGEAIPVFRLLAVAAVIHPMLAATGWVYISLGETRRLFRVGLCAAVWFVASFVVGLPYGARGVALAYSISVALAIVPLLVAMCRGTPLSVVAVLRTVLPYFTSAAIAACCVYLLECRFVPSEIPHISRIALSGGLFGIIYLALVSLSSRETRDLIRAAPITLVRALHS